MSGTTAMAVLIGILAVILVGAFLAVWMRDKGRSNDVSHDPGRTDTGRTDTDPSNNHRNPGH